MNAPERLRTEYLENPLGVDVPAPRFSWHPVSERRGAQQVAWQVTCSSSAEAAEQGRGDLWDSGRVESEQDHLVPYAGARLSSFSRVFWRVRTWEDTDARQPSPWSGTSVFETAALSPADWSASWISMPDPSWTGTRVLVVSSSINAGGLVDSRQHWGIYGRKEFVLDQAPVRARAYVCGLGCHELYLNGQRLGSHRLDPGQTDYNKFALYSAHDATRAARAGRNVVHILLGNGRYVDAYGFGKPRCIVQLLLWFGDESTVRVVTDGTWKFSHGPLRRNGIYDGELYDAREEIAGWEAPGFDDRAWKAAEIVEGHPLRSQAMPPVMARTELVARSLSSPKPGVYVFDFGQNLSGVVRLRAHGPRGTSITMRFAELLDERGGLDLGTTREAVASDVLILKGDGIEHFEPRFTYHGFRYVEVTGLPFAPTVDDATAVVIHTVVPQTGSFVCSDALVNRIHENVLWSQRSNLMSAPTDCPQRGERMGWLGDAQLASEEAVYNFDMAAFYRKYLDDMAAALAPDGSLSDVVPPYWPLYPADPAWGTAYVTLAWAAWEHYADGDTLRRHYASLRRAVDFLHSRAQGHILRGMGKYGDWCPPGSTFPKKTPTELTSTWYYYYDTLRMSWIADVLGNAEDKERYARRAAEIRQAFTTEFLAGGGRYRTIPMSPIDQQPGQTSQALPLFLDMVPADQREAAVARLQEAVEKIADFHVDTGIVGTRYLFEVLRDNGLAETAWKVATRTSYPGWGYMVTEGATTLWERWEKLAGQGMNSHNHIMFGTIDAWFYRTIGGLIPTSPGWRTVKIQPYVLGTLSHAAAKVDTIHGELASEWYRDGPTFGLAVRVPVGVTADVLVPLEPGSRVVREGGATLWQADASAPKTALPAGIRSADRSADRLHVVVGSGVYQFKRGV